MSGTAPLGGLIDQARLFFAEHFVRDLQPLQVAALEGAQRLNEMPAERALAQQRRDMLQDVMRNGNRWPGEIGEQVRERLSPPDALSTTSSALVSSMAGNRPLTLVDDETIQREIIVSRLSLALLDQTAWEFTDLRARLVRLLNQDDLDDHDLFRAQVLARGIVKAWINAGLSLDTWRGLEDLLHKACARQAQEAYHETNRWLIEQGVLPEVDLRPFIRRSDGTPTEAAPLDEAPPPDAARPMADGGSWAGARGAASGRGSAAAASLFPGAAARSGTGGAAGQGGGAGGAGGAGGPGGSGASAAGGARQGPAGAWGAAGGSSGGGAGGRGGAGSAAGAGRAPTTGYLGGLDDETRMMTRPVAGGYRTDVMLGQFSEVMERHLPGFKDTSNARPASARLAEAMAQAQERLVQRAGPSSTGEVRVEPSPSALMRDLRERHTELKQAAATPAERATIELVALLFQSILTEDRLPASLRVWFARLQMPTLRVAIAEPDFFSSEEHPARRLIDRMGACVMGFEGDTEVVGSPLEVEIKRVVQVVEAFPDTGRRVFQTVLNEFEKFLEGYFQDRDDTTRMGVSLAQQVEQRETLAIQYTIELRKMLSEVPVQDGVREFLFHIWADVLATTAVRHGPNSADVRSVRDAATELLWTASAKTTREERAEVIRRLPPLLSTLRAGMGAAGMSPQRQDDALRSLNLALTAAFGARAVAISPQQLEQLKRRLETIEELLPDDDFEIDDAWVMDEASHQHEGLEIVSEGGSMPDPDMLAWAERLRTGESFMLDYRGRHEPVRLSWQGMHRQLSLFTAGNGRCVLFQKARLAAFLQAGLLVPAQEESLTAAATRTALEKINADPSRLLN